MTNGSAPPGPARLPATGVPAQELYAVDHVVVGQYVTVAGDDETRSQRAGAPLTGLLLAGLAVHEVTEEFLKG